MKQWIPYKDGLTVGEKGSENGRILYDEEYLHSCRITLEKTKNIPYSITCGVYGLMCHTAFASTEIEAKMTYERMKKELEEFIQSEEIDEMVWLKRFVEKW